MPELRPYQIAGATFLAGRDKAMLADEPGLGKSAQAVRACADLYYDAHVMVVCPASMVEQWRREFGRFGNGLPRLTVLSYDKAVRKDHAMAIAESTGGLDVLILDEAHYLKSPKAKRTKAILGPKLDGAGGLTAMAKRVYLLTGTPMPNNPSELYAPLRACCPTAIVSPKTGKPYSYWQFVSKYCVTRNNGFGQQIVGGKNHAQLKDRINGFMLRRLKEEVAPDLPPITYADLCLDAKFKDDALANEELALVRKTLEEKGVEGLREIAGHVATLRRLTGLAKVEPAVEWVREWLDMTGRKIVLFAHHREVVEKLHEALEESVVISGKHSAEQRQAVVDIFQRDPWARVFIGQIQAAGTGITLTAASDVLFVESSWVPADNSQAAMRVHRIGQHHPCLIRFATLAGSIDERISQAVRRKTADITKIVG